MKGQYQPVTYTIALIVSIAAVVIMLFILKNALS